MQYFQATDTPVMKALSQKLQSGYEQTKFRPFWENILFDVSVSDEYKSYISQSRGLAIAHFNPNMLLQFQSDSKGEKLLHVGGEKSFGNYYGMKYRSNNIYNEVIIT